MKMNQLKSAISIYPSKLTNNSISDCVIANNFDYLLLFKTQLWNDFAGFVNIGMWIFCGFFASGSGNTW